MSSSAASGDDFSLVTRAVEAALGRVVLEQVGEVVGGHDVVDGDHVDSLPSSPCSTMARNTSRPMRPKPLMPTLTAIADTPCSYSHRLSAISHSRLGRAVE